jgi:hypothetical protein
MSTPMKPLAAMLAQMKENPGAALLFVAATTYTVAMSWICGYLLCLLVMFWADILLPAWFDLALKVALLPAAVLAGLSRFGVTPSSAPANKPQPVERHAGRPFELGDARPGGVAAAPERPAKPPAQEKKPEREPWT